MNPGTIIGLRSNLDDCEEERAVHLRHGKNGRNEQRGPPADSWPSEIPMLQHRGFLPSQQAVSIVRMSTDPVASYVALLRGVNVGGKKLSN